MTAVAVFLTSPEPLVLGDMLVTGREQSLETPAIGQPGNFFPDGHALSGLRQKIEVLADRLVVGWAGTAYVARWVIERIKEFAATNTLKRTPDFPRIPYYV